MSVLLTGGTGFIGSHTAVELMQSGYEVVIVDDLSNSEASVIGRIGKITGRNPVFCESNVADINAMERIFYENKIDAVIHFAGFKAVGESVENPLVYYKNNLCTTLTLLEIMERHGVNKLIFSSSALVYALSGTVPYKENETITGSINPYGWTKLMIEQILKDEVIANPQMSVVLLRYFNPIGAHETGLIGEKPSGIPNNLMPYITQVAQGILPKLNVFGNDYPTPDGTCIRDYIHVADLAKGHVAAMEYCNNNKGCEAINLGTGHGYSVLDIINTFEQVNNVKVPYVVTDRRPGDIASFYANTEKAELLLNWKAEKNIKEMCRDSWNWQQSIISK